MAIPKLTADVEIIRKLCTFPNREDGLTAEQLKEKFDRGSVEIRKYINTVLVPVLDKALPNAGDTVQAPADGVWVAGYLRDLAENGHHYAWLDGEYLVKERIEIPAGMTIIGGTFVADAGFEDALFRAKGDNVRLIGVTLKAPALDKVPSIYVKNDVQTTSRDSNVMGLYSDGHEGIAMLDCVCDKLIPAKIDNGSGIIHGCRITDCSMFAYATNCRLTVSDNDVSMCDTGLDQFYHVYYLDQDSELVASNNRIRCDTQAAYRDVYHPMTAGNKGKYRATCIIDGDVVVGNFQTVIDCHYADLTLKNCTIINTNKDSWTEFGNAACSSFVFENCDLEYMGAAGQELPDSMIAGRDIPEGVEPDEWKGSGYDTCYAVYDGCRIRRSSHLNRRATYRDCHVDLTIGGASVIANLCNVLDCRITIRGCNVTEVVEGETKTTFKDPQCIGVISSAAAKFDFCGNHVVFVHPNSSGYMFRYASLDGVVCNNVFSGVAAGSALWYGGADLGISQNNILKEVATT